MPAKKIPYDFKKWETQKSKFLKNLNPDNDKTYLLQNISEVETSCSISSKSAAYHRVGAYYGRMSNYLYLSSGTIPDVLKYRYLRGKTDHLIAQIDRCYPDLTPSNKIFSRDFCTKYVVGMHHEACYIMEYWIQLWDDKLALPDTLEYNYEDWLQLRRWDNIILLMVKQDYEAAKREVEIFRNAQEEMGVFPSVSGIISGKEEEMEAAVAHYLSIYDAIIERDEERLAQNIQDLLRLYRKQSSVDFLNLCALALGKMAVNAGMKVNVDTIEFPRALLENIPFDKVCSDIPQPEFDFDKVNMRIKDLPLQTYPKRIVQVSTPASKPVTNTAAEEPISNNQQPPLIDSYDPVIRNLHKIQEEEKKLTAHQKKLWCLLTLSRFHVILDECSHLPHFKFFSLFPQVVSSIRYCIFTDSLYPNVTIEKFLKGLGKIQDEGYLEDCEKKLSHEFEPNYLGDAVIQIEMLLDNFQDDKFSIASFILSTIFEDYNYNYWGDILEWDDPDAEELELSRIWNDYDFVLKNPAEEEVDNRIRDYKRIDLRNVINAEPKA